MKKQFYLFTCLMAVGLFSRAQIKQGATLVEGNIGFSTTSDNSIPSSGAERTTTVNVNPYFGKAIKQDLIVGFDLLYTHSSQDNINTISNNYGAGVFIRKYKYLGSHFYIFGQALLNGAYSIQKQMLPASVPPSEQDTKITSIQLSVNPGISYAINDKWQLEATLPNLVSINYVHLKDISEPASNSNDFTSNSFGLMSSLSNSYAPSIGVSFLFNR